MRTRALIRAALQAMAWDCPNAAVAYFRQAYDDHPLMAGAFLRLELRTYDEFERNLIMELVRGPALRTTARELFAPSIPT